MIAQPVEELAVICEAQKQMLNAKMTELMAFGLMSNPTLIANCRDQAHTILDTYCDTVNTMTLKMRESAGLR